MDIGEKIKEIRKNRKLSQAELASHLNDIQIGDSDLQFFPQTISYWEHGRDPSIEALKKLSIFSDQSIDFLVGNSDLENVAEADLDLVLGPKTLKSLKSRLSALGDVATDITLKKYADYLSFIYEYHYSDASKAPTREIFHLSAIVEIARILSSFMDSIELDLDYSSAHSEDPTYSKNIYMQFSDKRNEIISVMDNLYVALLEKAKLKKWEDATMEDLFYDFREVSSFKDANQKYMEYLDRHDKDLAEKIRKEEQLLKNKVEQRVKEQTSQK